MYIFVIPFSDTLTSVPGLSSEGLGYSCLGEYACPCLGVQLPTAIKENRFRLYPGIHQLSTMLYRWTNIHSPNPDRTPESEVVVSSISDLELMTTK